MKLLHKTFILLLVFQIVSCIENRSGDSNESNQNAISIQQDFERWLLEETTVIDVHFVSDWQIWVTLESYKYTSKRNVQQIAEKIAKWYAQKMGKRFTACTVWQGNNIYAKGNFSN